MQRMNKLQMELAQEVEKILDPLSNWYHQCHAASIELVQKGNFTHPARVARGFCKGVGGQHSWVVLSDDVYSQTATIIDPTLWSYNSKVKGVWVGQAKMFRHAPHGSGNLFFFGRPPAAHIGYELPKPKGGWSKEAEKFLQMLGPIDLDGWKMLAHMPMEGWPSKEIVTQMCQDEKIRWFIPVDIVGMCTDLNPGGLYIKGEERK